ncbi:MAG: hypothetical protein A3J76_02475 [Candidatus Moranbacteria bacterium RBG_13_45_13]|nr:MAG: hypothetical protein A3J76_02475 [Candidatus Moranbacteria bacterium RBG_13_45_13]
MLTKKLLYFAIPVLLLVIIGVFLLAFRGNKTGKQGTDTESSSVSTSNKSPDANNDKITIETPSGEVTLNNFKKNAEVSSSGVLYFIDKDKYNIGYNPTSQEFIVTLLVGENVENTRKDAESDLLNSLGVSRGNACKLNVFLYVSAAINKNLSQNHGLSSCPDSQPFTQ